MKKTSLLALCALALTASIVSCTKEDDPTTPNEVPIAVDFTLADDHYDFQGVWNDVYNPEITTFGIYPVRFSHKAEVTEYDGVKYKSFTGFCPSIVVDDRDYTGQDWTQYQFASIAFPAGYGYLIAHWDVRENDQTPLKDRSCLINFSPTDEMLYTVKPIAMTITNTTYGYYGMKNGTAFSKAFGPNDECILYIHGVLNGVNTVTLSVDLAKGGAILDYWKQVDLRPLGPVQQIYFTMQSSDTGEWGMNNPAYFAMGTIESIYTVQ